jgi:hypothetical protein
METRAIVVKIACDTDAAIEDITKHSMVLLKGGGGDAIVLHVAGISVMEAARPAPKKSKKS